MGEPSLYNKARIKSEKFWKRRNSKDSDFPPNFYSFNKNSLVSVEPDKLILKCIGKSKKLRVIKEMKTVTTV